MSRGSACASRRDRAFVLPEEPQQRRLAEWRNRGTRRPTGWEDKRARRLAEFAARMPAIMAQMTSGVSEAIAEALQATRAEHLKELDLAPTPTTTSVISESSTSIQMSGGSSSISTAGGGASASHDFVLPSAVPITCSTDCPQRDNGSTDATAATSASATGAVSTMCVLHEGGVHLAMSCFQPRDKLTFVLPSTATPATSSVPQTIALAEYVVAPANSSANIMVGPEARIPTTTTPAASAALELDPVIALPANRVCLDNVPAMPATVLLQDALIIADSGSSDVLVSMSASLDKLEAADTAVTHEEQQQLTCLSVERTLASVSAKDVANDGNLVTGTSVMTLTFAILGVHVDSIADKREAIASSAVPPIKLIHGDSNSGDTVSMLPWDPGDSTIRLWTMKIMFQYVTRYEFLAVPWDSGQQVTNGHKCHTGLDFTMVLYVQDVTDTCLEQLQSQRTNYSWSTYLQFGKLQDAMGALLDMKSWPFWLFALEYFDGGNMFRQPSRGLYLELYLLVLVVMRKEAALWTIFQSASRDTILLLHWDPGALMYEMCTKFQVELEQKWMVSSIASSLAMLYTIHYHFPSGNLMLLDTAAANSNIITYLHSKGPPAGDESACVASKHLLVPNASTSPGFSFTRIGVLVTLSPGLGVGQGSNMLFAVCPVHWKIVWSIVLECSASGNKYGQPFVTTILNCEDYFEKRSTVLPPFSPRTVQADWSHSLQVDWSQLYHVGNYDCLYLTSNKSSTGAFHSSAHVSVSGSCSMNLGQGQLSWDPGIRALLTFYDGDCEQVHGVDQVHIGHVLCSYELFTQAAAQVGIKVDATTYCYSHFISSFLDQALLSHDYYIDIVQVHLGHFYSISHHNHLGAGKIKESHVPWDPGGLTWHRLGGKPKFMEEGLSATLLCQSWAGQWAAVCWAWAYSEARRRSTTNRRGTTMEGVGSEPDGGAASAEARLGKVALTWFGPEARVVVADPKLFREILSNKHGQFGKQKSILGIERLLANGLTTHQGEKWVTHRRIINHAFHLEKLKRMLPAFAACSGELVSRWGNSVGSGDAQEIDVWPEFQNLTGDAISRVAFGSSFGEGRKIFQLQSEQAQNAVKMANLMYIPGYRFLPTKLNRRMKANAREVETLLKGIITKRERATKDGHADNDDLLGLMMESNIKETQEAGSSKPTMTTDDIVGELKLFYFAGMETTAVLLTWAIVVLSMHPAWQDRAREEVLRVFGKNQPDSEGINRLKVVTMILHEVLRLYPPILLLGREAYEETELGGVTYPPGVTFGLPIVSIHHDPDVWGQDVDEFKPERFAEGVAAASKDSPAFFPFGWGPRICVGQNFALLEAKMGLSMILQHFLFELSPSYAHAPCPVSTLQPQHGAQIMLRKL